MKYLPLVERVRRAIAPQPQCRDCADSNGRCPYTGELCDLQEQADEIAKAVDDALATVQPVAMLLYCPRCNAQHVDLADAATGWDNPPHKSHLCRHCNTVWRPADVPTYGVITLMTRGERDNFDPAAAERVSLSLDEQAQLRAHRDQLLAFVEDMAVTIEGHPPETIREYARRVLRSVGAA